MEFDYVLVGGGLQSGLIALALLDRRPALRLAIVERGPRVGGNHTWCFHEDDVPDGARRFVEPLVVHRWSGYDVVFPSSHRRLGATYSAVTSERFAAALEGRLAAAPAAHLLTGAEAVAIEAHEVRLADGRVLSAQVVVDARGPDHGAEAGHEPRCGYQKFVGLEVRLARPHDRERPLLMDATVPQDDGYRFVYTLPLAPDRLLIEDTRFSDSPLLDREALHDEVLAYAARQGWEVTGTIREEHGVLPLPWDGDVPSPTEGPLRAGYRGGFFHPVSGYSFPIAVRLALLVAASAPEALFGPTLAAFVAEHRRQRAFAHRLNWMLFKWFAPKDRYNVLERFYTHPEPLIRRFYALELTALDRARMLVGRPPRGLDWRAALAGPEVPRRW